MLIKNARNRARKWAAERMDMLGKSASKPLKDVIRQYNYQLPILHPFEATLADLTVRAREKTGEGTLQVRERYCAMVNPKSAHNGRRVCFQSAEWLLIVLISFEQIPLSFQIWFGVCVGDISTPGDSISLQYVILGSSESTYTSFGRMRVVCHTGLYLEL